MSTNKEPKSVAAVLNEKLKEWGMNQSELARYIGLSTQVIHRVCTGKGRLQMREAVLFDDVFGTQRGYWADLATDRDYWEMERALKKRGKKLSKKSLEEFRDSEELT